ncbi:sensor histidine kinase [Kitasatospora sp. NPDC101447]|uniref:sensor histidine kinase n=1 Tax=Kitasatospora sp. NPDC101447 TaxID=3364102 RepID=UPI0038232516
MSGEADGSEVDGSEVGGGAVNGGAVGGGAVARWAAARWAAVTRTVAERRRFLAVRGDEMAFAVLGLPLGVLGGVYAVAVLYAGVLLSLTVLGLPFLAAALLGARRIGRMHRWLVEWLLDETVPGPPPLPRPSGLIARGRIVLTDPVAWRVLLYLFLRLPVGVLGFLAAVGLPLGGVWLVGFPLWVRLAEPGPRPVGWSDVLAIPVGLALLAAVPAVLRALSRANRALARTLLGPVRSQQRVRELESARATLLTENSDRLRRLERDLHDGTQAQLVALAITLSLADDALADPAEPDLGRLRTLVDRARGQTDDTITGLRRLTRGIHPVALDGGLAEALPGLTATSPVPVTVRLDLRERPVEVIERAVYFCAAELLTNVAKHSGARSADLTASAADGRVRLTVRDDGRGGAAIGTGSGLAGLAERLAAVDGVLRVDSPPGGPTVVSAELPDRL